MKYIKLPYYTGEAGLTANDINLATANATGTRVQRMKYMVDQLYADSNAIVYLGTPETILLPSSAVVFSVAETPVVSSGNKMFTVRVHEDTTVIATGGATICGTDTGLYKKALRVTASVTHAANPDTTLDRKVYYKSTGAGSIIFIDKTKIHKLYCDSTSGIAGDITGMALTYISLSSTGSAVSGDITGMPLTYISLSGTDSAVSGNITGMALTCLWVSGAGSDVSGDITGMPLTYLVVSSTGTVVSGDITGMALIYMSINNITVSGATKRGYTTRAVQTYNASHIFTSVENIEVAPTNITVAFVTDGSNKTLGVTNIGNAITVQLATNSTGASITTATELRTAWNDPNQTITDIANCVLVGDGSGIVAAMSAKTLVSPVTPTATGIIVFGQFSAAEYRQLFYMAAQKTTAGTQTFTIGAGNSPGYALPNGVKPWYDLVCQKWGTVTIPTAWVGGTGLNDFPIAVNNT